MSLLLDAPLTMQPQELVELNLDHPAAQGLVGFWHAGTMLRATNGVMGPTLASWHNREFSVDHMQCRVETAANGDQSMVSSGSTIYASLWNPLCPPSAVTILHAGVVTVISAEGGGSTGWGMYNMGGGTYRVFFRAADQGAHTIVDVPLNLGVDTTFGFSYDGTAVRGVVGGEYVNSVAATGAPMWKAVGGETNPPIAIGTWGGPLGGSVIGTPSTRWFAMWDRALSPEELREVSANPWGMFLDPSPNYVPQSAPVSLPRRYVPDVVLDTQPQEYVEVDWGNPITSGLVWAQVGASPQNVVGGISDVIGGTLNPRTDSGMAGLDMATTAYLRGQQRIGGASRGATGLTLCTFDIVSGNRTLLGTFRPGGGGQIYLGLEGSRFGTVVFDGSYKINSSTVTPNVGQAYTVLGRFGAADTQDIFVDGALLRTDATAHAAQEGTIVVGDFNDGSGERFDGTMHLSLWWTRPLTDDEVRSVSANPWQLFRVSGALWLPAENAEILSADAVLSNTGWSPVGAASLNAALAAGDADYAAASSAGAVMELSLSDPSVPLILSGATFTIRASTG